MKIAVAFFGLARSLKYTIESIEQNVLAPLRSLGSVKIFGHLYNQDRILNSRSGEDCELDPNQHQLIRFDALEVEQPNDCLARFEMDTILQAGDPYNDGHKSIINLLHQLNSLDCVTALIDRHYKPSVVVFLRPDLYYHDRLESALKRLDQKREFDTILPSWQSHGGCNDRFAICTSRSYTCYGTRARMVNSYVSRHRPLFSELFLRETLRLGERSIATTAVRATRVRADGRHESEDFSEVSAISNFLQRQRLILRYALSTKLPRWRGID
jgi:hypothetical protein